MTLLSFNVSKNGIQDASNNLLCPNTVRIRTFLQREINWQTSRTLKKIPCISRLYKVSDCLDIHSQTLPSPTDADLRQKDRSLGRYGIASVYTKILAGRSKHSSVSACQEIQSKNCDIELIKSGYFSLKNFNFGHFGSILGFELL